MQATRTENEYTMATILAANVDTHRNVIREMNTRTLVTRPTMANAGVGGWLLGVRRRNKYDSESGLGGPRCINILGIRPNRERAVERNL